MSEQHSALVKRCIKQDPKAQKALYEQFAPKMMALCYRYASSRADAEDILQDGFIKVFQKIKEFKYQGSLEGWIRRIMVHTAIDHVRRNRKLFQQIEIDDAISDRVATQATDNLGLEELMGYIRQLPDGYRLIFNLYAIEGYSHKEIAAKMNIQESTSRSQYTRARALLKHKICGDHMESKVYKDVI